jgi:hypothetical protein
MNWDRIEGNWKEFKGKIQKKWGKLTGEISLSSRGKERNWPVACSNDTALPRTRLKRRSTAG